MKKWKLKWALPAVLLLLLLAAGCSEKSAEDIIKDALSNSTTGPAESMEPSEEPTTDPQEAENAKTEKYNSYINVNNFITDRLDTVIDSYFRNVKFQKKFALENGTDSYWCNSLGDTYYKIVDAAHEFSAKEPAFPGVDEAYEAMYPVMLELMKAFDEVYEYTDMKNYEDDNLKKGRQLHKTIWQTYNQYEDLAQTFYDELEKVAEKQRAEDLKMYKEKGFMAHYTFVSLIMAAQDIQNAIYKQEVSDANLLEMNTKKLMPLYEKFKKLAAESLDYLKDEEQMKKEYGAAMVVFMFERSIKETKVSLTNLFKRVKDKRELETYELNSSFPAKGTVSEFEEKLGDMIRNYNTLQN